MIKQFKIEKLFGFRDVNIQFEDNIKILIGENGLGKTTILNSLYYLLDLKLNKLSQIEFKSILLLFSNGKKVSFTKDELIAYLDILGNRENSFRRRIKRLIDIEQLNTLYSKNNDETYENIDHFIKNNPQIRRFAPIEVLRQEILQILLEYKSDKFSAITKIIKNNVGDILYFPTYRRVEEDLKNLGKFRKKYIHNPFENEFIVEEIDEEIEIGEDTLIHFGMEDVEQRIKKIEYQIKQSSINGFSKVTGEMLSQLLRGFPKIKEKDIRNLDTKTIEIVVHRVGDNLNKNDKEKILSLINNKDELIKKEELVYFILKLVEIYEQHKHLDDAIKKFKDTCNSYLVDKEFRYDESSVSLKIFRSKTNDIVTPNKLSSGEKQIVSLFSKLYLENFKNLIILFDEPELSLSIEWQKKLLPDIIASNKCNFLVSVTHSPFIFKNKLEKYAIGMNIYVK